MPTCEPFSSLALVVVLVRLRRISAAKLKVAGDTPATTEATMLYMVIEHFKNAPAIYRRLREKGRMMPDGLNYISSWNRY
jgi:tRNA splicing endonuclease